MIASLALILIATSAPVQPVSHVVEIKAFANAVAVARTVKEACPGIAIDEGHLEALRRALHVVEADDPAYVPEARATADVLHKGLSEAPSPSAWCDAAYRLYGPDGRLIPDLVRREAPTSGP